LTGSGREQHSEKISNLYCLTKCCWGDDVREKETYLDLIVDGEMKNVYWIVIGNLRRRDKAEVWHNIKMEFKRKTGVEVGGPSEE